MIDKHILEHYENYDSVTIGLYYNDTNYIMDVKGSDLSSLLYGEFSCDCNRSIMIKTNCDYGFLELKCGNSITISNLGMYCFDIRSWR